jgi:hypothetical protein
MVETFLTVQNYLGWDRTGPMPELPLARSVAKLVRKLRPLIVEIVKKKLILHPRNATNTRSNR